MRLQYVTIIFFCLAVAFWGCKESDGVWRPSAIEFEGITVDTVVSLTADAGAPECILKLEIKIAKGEHAQQINDTLLRSGILVPDYLSLDTMSLTPREAVDYFVKETLSDWRRFYTPIFKREGNKEYARQSFELTTSVQGGRDGVTNYIANICIVSGGQNSEYRLVRNIDEHSGNLLSLNDVFIDGSEEAVGEEILKHLMRREDSSNKNERAPTSIDELPHGGFFAGRAPYPSQNFLLGNDTITFIYGSGEIADRQKGEIHVDIHYGKLRKWLKE